MPDSAMHEEKRPIRTKTPGIGQPIRWYPGGDTKREPRAAVCVRVNNRGMVDIVWFMQNCRQHQFVNGVRHRNDPDIERFRVATKENGVWDFTEFQKQMGYEFGDPITMEPPPDTPDELCNDDRHLVALHRGCEDATQIASEMCIRTGERWTYQKVNAHLRKLREAGYLTAA